jgi:glucose-1-phosphate thymidylyltransferase
VIELDNDGNPIRIVEKPKFAPSNYAVTGLYFYDNNVVEYAWRISPSARGELEITSINELYLNDQRLSLEILNRGFAWLDMGTNESLIDASIFVKAVENRQGLRIACIEEIAYKKKFINKKQFLRLISKFKNNSYGEYLSKII